MRRHAVAALSASALVFALAGCATSTTNASAGSSPITSPPATSHHVTTLGIERPQGDSARVKGHLQAWHVRKDGGVVIGLGTWEVDARRTAQGWRIVHEELESPLRVVVPKAE